MNKEIPEVLQELLTPPMFYICNTYHGDMLSATFVGQISGLAVPEFPYSMPLHFAINAIVEPRIFLFRVTCQCPNGEEQHCFNTGALKLPYKSPIAYGLTLDSFTFETSGNFIFRLYNGEHFIAEWSLAVQKDTAQ